MTKKITIAIDAMGGENAPKKNIEGLNIFLKKNIKNDDFTIQLFGDENILKSESLEWSITRGARSGRVAWQFIQDLAGKLKTKL